MLRQLRIEMDRFGQMKRSSWKPLPHSLSSDPHGDVKQLEHYFISSKTTTRTARNFEASSCARGISAIRSESFYEKTQPRAHRIGSVRTDRVRRAILDPRANVDTHRCLRDQTDIDGGREICARRIRYFASRPTKLKFILAQTVAPQCMSASIRPAWTRTSERLNALIAIPL